MFIDCLMTVLQGLVFFLTRILIDAVQRLNFSTQCKMVFCLSSAAFYSMWKTAIAVLQALSALRIRDRSAVLLTARGS